MADVLSPNTTISRYPAGDVVYVRRAYFYMFKSAYADCIGKMPPGMLFAQAASFEKLKAIGFKTFACNIHSHQRRYPNYSYSIVPVGLGVMS
jgi:hypothetical protein